MVNSISSSTSSSISSAANVATPPSPVREAERPQAMRQEPPPQSNQEATRVTLSGDTTAQPNTANFNAKPTQMYEAVSALR